MTAFSHHAYIFFDIHWGLVPGTPWIPNSNGVQIACKMSEKTILILHYTLSFKGLILTNFICMCVCVACIMCSCPKMSKEASKV